MTYHEQLTNGYADARARLFGTDPETRRRTARNREVARRIEMLRAQNEQRTSAGRALIQWRDVSRIARAATHHVSIAHEPTLAEIMVWVEQESGIPASEMNGRRKHERIVKARHLFYYLARLLTSESYPRIAACCGRNDHTAALYGVRKHCERNGLPHPDEAKR